MYEDREILCKECNESFVFSAEEQEFYAARGLENDPQRCKPCRTNRRAARRAPRTYTNCVCAECGGEARVPFTPSDDRPVYCSDCFQNTRNEITTD